jgi:hypothetical protein
MTIRQVIKPTNDGSRSLGKRRERSVTTLLRVAGFADRNLGAATGTCPGGPGKFTIWTRLNGKREADFEAAFLFVRVIVVAPSTAARRARIAINH